MARALPYPDGLSTCRIRTAHAADSAVWEASAVGKRILVAEEDLHSREGLRDSLIGEGYWVETAEDSWQAIRKVKERLFDVAIIDLELPPVHGITVDGWDLARIFRAYHPGMSIIVLSAEEEGAARPQAERLRVSEFLEKPISPARLKAIVRTLEPSSPERSINDHC